MVQIGKRLLKSWEKLNADIQAFKKETGEDEVTLYEDAHTTRNVSGFALGANGCLTWVEDGKWENWYFTDEDEAREWLSFWRANLRRAKKYWEMDAIELDRLQEGEIEDEEE